MGPMDTMLGPVAADIACLAVVGGCHASSICVPYEDHSTGASSVTVRFISKIGIDVDWLFVNAVVGAQETSSCLFIELPALETAESHRSTFLNNRSQTKSHGVYSRLLPLHTVEWTRLYKSCMVCIVDDKRYIEACDDLSIRRNTRSWRRGLRAVKVPDHPSGKPWRKPIFYQRRPLGEFTCDTLTEPGNRPCRKCGGSHWVGKCNDLNCNSGFQATFDISLAASRRFRLTAAANDAAEAAAAATTATAAATTAVAEPDTLLATSTINQGDGHDVSA